MVTPNALAGRAEETASRVRLEARDRREQIMRAAQELFADRPYEAVSTGEIAQAAGTTRTNVLYHFASKRALFIEVLGRFVLVPATFGRGKDRAERVSSLLDDWLALIERNRAVFLAVLGARTSSDPQLLDVLEESMAGWRARLAAVLNLEPVSVSDTAMLRSFQAMTTVATEAWLISGELTRAQVLDMLTSTLLALAE